MKNKGITLIALVVTIIVLIILAGISISLILGENGIIKKAKNAKIETDIASIKEEIQEDILTQWSENEGSISDDALKEILEKYGTLSEEEKLIDKTLTTTEKKYEIRVSDIFSGTTVKDVPKNPTFTTVANAPDTTEFNKSNTYYVSWNLTNSPYQINEDTNLNGIAPINWYDYTEGVNHWANIKTTGGGNDCYWVWIPRYAYCITEGYHSNTAGTIDIKFLQGTSNTPIDGSSLEIINSSGSGNWNVHPAFWFDKNNNGVEDDGEQLTGIWVAKFEASSNALNVVENPTETDLEIDGGSDVDTDLKVRVKPNVTSWRGITANDMFTVCKNLITSGNSLESTTRIDSHMMKNKEWGAVAYLSISVYGKNGEIWNNPYYNNTNNYSPITGLCSNETDGKDKFYRGADITKTCKYNELGGGNASTTGNVYGVYDMAGGANEFVAGVYKGKDSYDLGSDPNRSNLWDSENIKYVDLYTSTSGTQSTYFGNISKFGNAVYETSSSGNATPGSWFSDSSKFPTISYPIFMRGGHSANNTLAGLFAFDNASGHGYTAYSFRPVVLSF